jgi:hypothetical protein
MIEINGNLWNHVGKADVICITTNGFVKKNGAAVMGRGCALQARNNYPNLAKLLGSSIRKKGNNCNFLIKDSDTHIYSFPVKHIQAKINSLEELVPHMRNKLKVGDMAPGWALKADMELILTSANQMLLLANENNWSTIIIPRPGCGAGELSWTQVGLSLHSVLDDRFKAITF